MEMTKSIYTLLDQKVLTIVRTSFISLLKLTGDILTLDMIQDQLG